MERPLTTLTHQGVANNTHVNASFTTCFTQFSHYIYGNAEWNP